MDKSAVPIRWSSAGLSGREEPRLAWQRALSDVAIPVEVACEDAPRFDGHFDVFAYASLLFLHVRSRRQWMHGSGGQAGNQQWFFVSTMTRGRGWLHTESGSCEVNTGDVSFVDSSRAFSLEFRDRFAYISTMIERSALEGIVAFAGAAHGAVIEPPTAAALNAFMSSLVQAVPREREQGPSVDQCRVRDHLLGLIAAAVEPVARRRMRPVPSPGELLLSRVKAWLVSRLYRDDLNVEVTAALFDLSTRKMRRLFRSEGTTFSRWLLEQRLERCRRDIIRPENHPLTIGAIASRWGMLDPAYFSRCFKARYGCPPGDYRRRHNGDKEAESSDPAGCSRDDRRRRE